MADGVGVVPQVEKPKVVDLAGVEAVFGGDYVELGFIQFLTLAAVAQRPANLDDLSDAKTQLTLASGHLPMGQARPRQRWVFDGVLTHHIAGRIGHDYPTPGDGFDEAQTELGFGQAVPALAGGEIQ